LPTAGAPEILVDSPPELAMKGAIHPEFEWSSRVRRRIHDTDRPECAGGRPSLVAGSDLIDDDQVGVQTRARRLGHVAGIVVR